MWLSQRSSGRLATPVTKRPVRATVLKGHWNVPAIGSTEERATLPVNIFSSNLLKSIKNNETAFSVWARHLSSLYNIIPPSYCLWLKGGNGAGPWSSFFYLFLFSRAQTNSCCFFSGKKKRLIIGLSFSIVSIFSLHKNLQSSWPCLRYTQTH